MGIARRRGGTSAANDLLERVLLLDVPGGQRQAALDFVMRWQQFTGSLVAGLEDTAFYRYNALVSMNEVGASPDGPRAMSVAAFHDFSTADFEAVTLCAVDAAFCDDETRQRIRSRVVAGYSEAN